MGDNGDERERGVAVIMVKMGCPLSTEMESQELHHLIRYLFWLNK